MAHGVLTVQVAQTLQKEFDKRGFDVLHDHGQKDFELEDTPGKLRSWFGSDLTRETALADLDLAIVSRETDKAYALIEIEETTHKPKVILGDIFATLLGSGIAFNGKHLGIGSWTTLIVLVRNIHASHESRMAYLEQQANQLKVHLATPNASMGRIILASFQDEVDLESKLRGGIEESLPKTGV